MRRMIVISIGVGILAATGLGGRAGAQEAEDDGLEVTRGADDLQAATGTPVGQRERIETALVFSDRGRRETRVACRATDADGNAVGRAFTRVPAGGLRVLLASDLSNGAAFAGQVSCRVDGRAHGTALLLAPAGLTEVGNAQGERISPRGTGRLHFPVVVVR